MIGYFDLFNPYLKLLQSYVLWIAVGYTNLLKILLIIIIA